MLILIFQYVILIENLKVFSKTHFYIYISFD